MGIDPGLRSTGWGVIEVDGHHTVGVGSGVIRSSGEALAERLLTIYSQLTVVVESYAPDQVAIEQTFVSRDGASTLKLGHARGIALLVPAKARMPVHEYAPNTVKKAVTGVGHASKQQVAYMVGVLLAFRGKISVDQSDALAVALTHAAYGRSAGVLRTSLAQSQNVQ